MAAVAGPCGCRTARAAAAIGGSVCYRNPTCRWSVPPAAGGVASELPPCRETFRRSAMLYWALVFFVLALIAGVFGFGGIASASAAIAQILFFIFLFLLVVSLFLYLIWARRRLLYSALSKPPWGN